MSECAECLRAMQAAVHKTYAAGCIGCGVRRLTYMDTESRERGYDAIQHCHGWDARAEAVRLVNLERARIEALKGPHD